MKYLFLALVFLLTLYFDMILGIHMVPILTLLLCAIVCVYVATIPFIRSR